MALAPVFKTTLSRRGIEEPTDMIGMSFLSPERVHLGRIIGIELKEGPYCDVVIEIEPSKIQHPWVLEIFGT